MSKFSISVWRPFGAVASGCPLSAGVGSPRSVTWQDQETLPQPGYVQKSKRVDSFSVHTLYGGRLACILLFTGPITNPEEVRHKPGDRIVVVSGCYGAKSIVDLDLVALIEVKGKP